MPTTLNFLSTKMPDSSLATAVMLQLLFVGRVNLLLKDSSDDVF